MDARQLLSDTLAAVPGLNHQVIAAALSVSPNTVARWSRGEMTARDEEHLRQLAWFRAQRNAWYLLTMPAVLLLWQPARGAPASPKPANYDPSVGPIASVLSRPVPGSKRVIEYEMTLDATFQSMSFIAMGPDRARILLSNKPNGGWGSTASFDKRLKCGSSNTKPSLQKGSKVSLFVKYSL